MPPAGPAPAAGPSLLVPMAVPDSGVELAPSLLLDLEDDLVRERDSDRHLLRGGSGSSPTWGTRGRARCSGDLGRDRGAARNRRLDRLHRSHRRVAVGRYLAAVEFDRERRPAALARRSAQRSVCPLRNHRHCPMARMRTRPGPRLHPRPSAPRRTCWSRSAERRAGSGPAPPLHCAQWL